MTEYGTTVKGVLKFIITAVCDIAQSQTGIVITWLIAYQTGIPVVFPGHSYG
jgi:hypothetical protein